jgi:hypothetical protein
VPLMTESLNLGRLMLILVLRPGKSNKSCYFAAVHESVHGTYQTKLAGQSMSALPGYFRHQLVLLSTGRHPLQYRDV